MSAFCQKVGSSSNIFSGCKDKHQEPIDLIISSIAIISQYDNKHTVTYATPTQNLSGFAESKTVQIALPGYSEVEKFK